jgi:hypothetical protein
MIDDTTITISEAGLQGELQILVDEIRLVEQQLEDMRVAREAARQAEDEAGQALRAAEQVFVPLLAATRQDDQQAISAVGDSWWRMSFPQAAQAYGQVQACQQECQKAAARTDSLHRAVLYVEKQKLPGLRTAAGDKQQELEHFRAREAQAVQNRDITLKDNLDRFRRKLRGEKVR